MLLTELTDQQVAMADVEQDPNVRKQQANLSPQQLSQLKAKQIQNDRNSQDPLKRRIAQLRQQLAQLIQQDQQRNNSATVGNGAQDAATAAQAATSVPSTGAPNSGTQ